MERRDFLTTSLTALAVYNVLPPLAGEAAALTPGALPIDSAPLFGAARFRRLLGSRFTIEREGVSRSVTLADVNERPQAPGLEQFTTVFASERAQTVAPGLYRVHHPELGVFELRLDHFGRETESAAVFNLLV